MPTKNELNVLFNNHVAIGGFNVSGSTTPASVVDPAGWYWSATPYGPWAAWCQRFSDGLQGNNAEDGRLSVRLVR